MYHASDENPLCGDEIHFDISINNGLITEIGFWGEACVLTLATAAMLAERFHWKRPEEIDPFVLIGVPVTRNRRECVLLPWRVLCISFSGKTA